jgi:hypothetical protein
VDAVGHPHVGVQGAVIAPGGLAQPGQIGAVVTFLEEHRLAAVAALDDVGRDIG